MDENRAENIILESIKLACQANGIPVPANLSDNHRELLGYGHKAGFEQRRSAGTAGDYLKNVVSGRVAKPLAIWIKELAQEWVLINSTAGNPKPMNSEHAAKIMKNLEKARSKRQAARQKLVQ